MELDKNLKDLKVLFDEDTLQKRIKTLANEIEKEHQNKDEDLHVICVLKGSALFCCDLIKKLNLPIILHFIRISSYGNDFQSSGKINTIDLTLPDLKDKNVLIVEDILDTGHTAKFVTDLLNLKYCPKSLKFATLLNKKCARQNDIEADFIGFEIDDKFVVGYGLDYKEYFRNIPYIGYFEV